MIPFGYEFKRVVTSKTVAIITGVIIVLSLVIAVTSAVTYNGPSPSQDYQPYGYAYGTNGSYNIVIHIDNGFGEPVQGTPVNVTIPGASNYSSSTNVNGYANFTGLDVKSSQMVPRNGGFPSFNFTEPSLGRLEFRISVLSNLTGYHAQETYVTHLFNGSTLLSVNNISRYMISGEYVLDHPDRRGLNIFYVGELGSSAPEIDVFYHAINTSTSGGGQPIVLTKASEKNMTYYGAYSGSDSYNINPSNLTSSNSNSYEFGFFTPNGSLIQMTYIQIYQPYSSEQVNAIFFGNEMTILEIFVPLMAVVTAYVSFGREKTSSVLDSVLARPVSRKGLLTSRYFANVSAVYLASVAAFAISSLTFYLYLGRYIPANALELGMWSMLVSVASMTGLMYLASSFFKSEGSLLGFGIAVFLIFDLLWTFPALPLIPGIVTFYILHLSPISLAAERTYILLDYISPTGLLTLSGMRVTGSAGNLVSVGNFSFGTLWLTVRYMVEVGIFWIAASFMASLASFLRRD